MILREVLLVGVRVGVGLLVVAVLVLMLDVLVIVQHVCVRMRRIIVGVLVSVLRCHCLPRPWSCLSDKAPAKREFIRALIPNTTHLARTGNSLLE